MKTVRIAVPTFLLVSTILTGCHRPSITSRPLSPWNQCEPAGVIPFYLPKPLLVVSKNFYRVEEAQVGRTDSVTIPNKFDDQSTYGDVAEQSGLTVGTKPSSPGGAATDEGTVVDDSGDDGDTDGGDTPDPTPVPQAVGPPEVDIDDGLAPNTFYTYQLVFVPDLSQKYGLKITGGPGEVRAAMNLVNGWQFTGLGPYYLKDSSTAQNILSRGIQAKLVASGASDVISSLVGVSESAQQNGGVVTNNELKALAKVAQAASFDLPEQNLPKESSLVPGYAAIHVYEPYVTPEGTMEWREIDMPKNSFDRFFLGEDLAATSRSIDTEHARTEYGFYRDKWQLGEEHTGSSTSATPAVPFVTPVSSPGPELIPGHLPTGSKPARPAVERTSHGRREPSAGGSPIRFGH